MAGHSVRNAVSVFNAQILLLTKKLLNDISISKLLEKFDQLWTQFDNGKGGIIKDGSHEGYSYEEMSGSKLFV